MILGIVAGLAVSKAGVLILAIISVAPVYYRFKRVFIRAFMEQIKQIC